MAQIPPIGDAYIDEIIKAVDPNDSSLNKTQGVKLRELIKLMRDRMEQGIAESLAMQKTYTVLSEYNIVVSPANYLDQPTTFIANRNSGEDIVISFENYSGADDQGKVYHIKNMGLTSAIILSSAGALFDGQSLITLPQYASVSIMSVNLPQGSGIASMWAILCSKGKAAEDVLKVLTLNVNGLPANVEVAVNGVVWPNRQKAFAPGTVLQNLAVTSTGYSITPANVPNVTMDEDKSLIFEAVETGDDPFLTIVVNGIVGPYDVAANNVLWPNNQKSFPLRTVLENFVVTVEDYDISPSILEQVVVDEDKTLTFTGVSQGFSHIDIEWEPSNGGHLNVDVFRDGNTLTAIPGSSGDRACWTDLKLHDGNVGSIKCMLHQGIIGILKNTEVVGGHNTFAYSVLTETDGRIVAAVFLNTDKSQYVSLPGYVWPRLIEIEFTLTEVIWYHGDARTEWLRIDRLSDEYYIGAGVYEKVENIRQKGFISDLQPVLEPLPGFSFLTIDASDFSNTLINTDNIWTVNGASGRGRPNKRMPQNSVVAVQFNSNSVGSQVQIKGSDDWFADEKITLEVDENGVTTVIVRDVLTENLPVQPSPGQYIGMTFLEDGLPNDEAKVRVSILDNAGGEVYGKDYFPKYVGFNNNSIQFNIYQNDGEIAYPQGIGLEDYLV